MKKEYVVKILWVASLNYYNYILLKEFIKNINKTKAMNGCDVSWHIQNLYENVK